jgi:lysine-N-methylase
MRKTELIRPEYAEQFRCIGAACEDSCCSGGWAIAIDQRSYERYQTIPTGPLRALIDASVARQPDKPDGSGPDPRTFAIFKIPPSRQCPFHNPDRLCQIQVEHGAEFLCDTCRDYPRIPHEIDQFKEAPLSLSCPEAARHVLLNPDLLARSGKGAFHMYWDDARMDNTSLIRYFWPIREFVLGLVRNRAYPLWQRLFLLGAFCRRFDAIARGELDLKFPIFLRDFCAAVGAGTLRSTMETIPADLALQLEILLRMVKLRSDMEGFMSRRFAETLHDFSQGIGLGCEATTRGHLVHYATAYRDYYSPFFATHPYILENYLINAIFVERFPFGKEPVRGPAQVEAVNSFVRLATKFALIKGLLIGVAGFHKEAFNAEHVVQTVQNVFKDFEHCAAFLEQAQELLMAKKMVSAQGVTMLVRN